MQTLEECQTCANIKLRRVEKWEKRISIGNITCSLPCPYCPVLALGFPLLLSNPLGSLLPQYRCKCVSLPRHRHFSLDSCNNPSLTGLFSHVGFSGRLQNWLKLMNTPTNCPPASHSGGASIVVYPFTFFFVLILFHFEWLDSLGYSNNYTVQLSFLWFLKQYDLEYVVGSFLFSQKKTIKNTEGHPECLNYLTFREQSQRFLFPLLSFSVLTGFISRL